jgi:hypothetical protein
MATSEVWLFLMLLPELGLLCLYSWMLLELYDLKHDFTNPFDCCVAMNAWVKPELYAHPIMAVLYIIIGPYWILAGLHLAFAAWNISLASSKLLRFDDSKMLDNKYVKKRHSELIQKTLLQAFLMVILVYE